MCARFIGDQSRGTFLYESGTYAVASGTGQWVGQVQDSVVDDNENVTQVRYIGGSTRSVEAQVRLARDVEGTFNYFPQDWKMLAFALGSNVDAGSPSPYTHTISESDSVNGNYATSGTFNPFLSFSYEDTQVVVGTGLNFKRTVTGAIVDTLTIKAPEREIVSVEVKYIGQDCVYASGAPTSVTDAGTVPFTFDNLRVHIPSGTVMAGVRNFEMEINNNVERANYLTGSRVTQTPAPLARDYTVTLEMDGMSEQTKTLFDQYWQGGSSFNAMFEINASTGSRDAFIWASGCRITAMDAPTGMNDINAQSITIVPANCGAVVNDAIEKYNAW